jgi:hypothetical protein
MLQIGSFNLAIYKWSVERSKWDSKQPINIMDSNISDHVGDLDIQPYQFEPLCNDESQQEREHSTSEDSDIDESSQAQNRLVNTNWWGFVYLLTIFEKRIRDWTKIWNKTKSIHVIASIKCGYWNTARIFCIDLILVFNLKIVSVQ